MDTNRRDFIRGAATAMAVLPTFRTLSQESWTLGPDVPDSEQLNVAVIGFGIAGSILSEAAMKIPGIRFRAVCDIWKLNRDRARSFLGGIGHRDCNFYEDYREMLEKEDKRIDAVIVATPDWMHAEHTNACLRAGKHVYCETPMSNNLERAKSMVRTQRETGKILQIGNQRRSNSRYIHAINRVIREANMLGRVSRAYAQWHRGVAPFLTVRERVFAPAETLERYGYENMEQLLNWRWFAKYGGGPMLSLGLHGVDLFLWAFDCPPVSVIAVGDNDYYNRQENDNVTALYEFKTKDGKISRAQSQVLSTTSYGAFYERFMGEDGALEIAEISSIGNSMKRETRNGVPAWDKFVAKGLIRDLPKKPPGPAFHDLDGRKIMCCGSSCIVCGAPSPPFRLPIELNKPAHMPHLENFFFVIRSGRRDLLTCPPEVAYQTLVAVLAANESVAKRQTITFEPGAFRV